MISKAMRILVTAATAATTLCILGTAEKAYAYKTEGCKWKSADVTVFHYDTGSYRSDTNQAEADWTDTLSPVEFTNKSSVVGVNMTTDAVNFGNTGYDGITNYTCSGGHFKNAEVRSAYNTYYTGSYSTDGRTQVMVHELGHALGLAHSGSSKCSGQPIMYYSSDRYFTCHHVSPQSDDIKGVNALY